jgi:hypothetical protein
MIARQRFVNALRGLGYTFQERKKRVEIFRKTGGLHRVMLNTHRQLAEPYVKSVLCQCGVSPEQADRIIADLRA